MGDSTINQADTLVLIVNGKRIMCMPESEDRFIVNPSGRAATIEVNSWGKSFHATTNSQKVEISIKVIQGSDDDLYLKALCELYFTTSAKVIVDYVQPLIKKAGIIVDCGFTTEPQDQFGIGNYVKEYTLTGVGVKS